MKNFLLLLLSTLIISNLNAQRRDTTQTKERDAIATKSLREILPSINQKNIAYFGFSSIEDAENAVLEKPFQVFLLPIDLLKNYTANTPFTAMLQPTNRYLYPILNNRTRKVTNAMGVDKVSNNWRVVNYGRSKGSINMAMALSNGNIAKYFIITIPAFNLDFVSYYEGANLIMVPVMTDPQNKLEGGKAYNARQVIGTYAQLARNYNGLPM